MVHKSQEEEIKEEEEVEEEGKEDGRRNKTIPWRLTRPSLELQISNLLLEEAYLEVVEDLLHQRLEILQHLDHLQLEVYLVLLQLEVRLDQLRKECLIALNLRDLPFHHREDLLDEE